MFIRKRNSFNEDDLESVIQACLLNDQKAQRMLFRQFFGYAKSICLRYGTNQEDAEEILNEGFLKVFQHLNRYDSNLPFKAWLRTIMVNTSISYYRKYHKSQPDWSLESVNEAALDEDAIDRISADEILAMVQKLSPSYRMVFLMYAVDGYSHREIADLLELNEATVRSQYVRARAKLKYLMQIAYPYRFPVANEPPTIRFNEN